MRTRRPLRWHPRLLLLPLLLAISVGLAPAALAQGFTLDHYARVARVTDLRLAPGGDRAAFVVAWPNYEVNAWESDIVEVSLRDRSQRTLTQRRTATSPRWSPTGDRIAFLAEMEGRLQLFVLPATGGDARQVTRSATGVRSFAWRPDGSGFAFVAPKPLPARGKFDDAFEVNGNDYLTLAAPRSAVLWSVGAEGGAATLLADGDWSIPSLFSTISWSADGRQIYFTKQESAGTREWERRSLAVLDVASGRVAPVAGIDGKKCGAGWLSPDGRQLLLSCPVDGHVKNQGELAVIPVGGGAFRRLTGAIDRNFSWGVWRGDSRAVLSGAPDGTRSALWEIPLEGAPRRIDVGGVGVNDAVLAADGSIVFIGSEAQRPNELYVLRPGAAAPERITDLHASVAALTLGTLESLS